MSTTRPLAFLDSSALLGLGALLLAIAGGATVLQPYAEDGFMDAQHAVAMALASEDDFDLDARGGRDHPADDELSEAERGIQW